MSSLKKKPTKNKNKNHKIMYSLACNSHNFSNNENFLKVQIKWG